MEVDEKRGKSGAGQRCLRCGVPFRCGMQDATRCWCTTLPWIDPAALAALDPQRRAEVGLPSGPLPAACLCPSCLATITAVLSSKPQVIPAPGAN
jgi:hypothetical protein